MAVAKRQQKRLGKGLSALLGDYLPEEGAGGPVENLPVAELQPNPYQPRGGILRDNLDELITSIRENGLLQPLLVRPVSRGGWEVVAGERRWRAVSELGWSHVPAVVREVDDRTTLVLALIENLQREELTPLDEAHAYKRLVDEFGLTQTQVAQRVGRDRSTVTNTLRLLGLPEPVLALLAAGKITAGHARPLLSLQDEDRVVRLARAAAESGLSVREVEHRVRERRPAAKGPKKSSKARYGASGAYAERAEQALSRALGTSVTIKLETASRGRVEIPFRDSEDFERIVALIVGVGGIV